MSDQATMIAETAAQISAAGFPDFLNRWLRMTPDSLAANEEARRQIAAEQRRGFAMPTIGKKEAALREQRAAETAPAATAPTAAGPAPASPTTRPNGKIHPADAANLAAIAEASHFMVSIFHDRQHHKREPFDSNESAIAAGVALKAELKSPRDFIVYAVLKDGRSFPVPRDYQAPTTQQETDMAKTATKAKTTTKKPAKPASSARAKAGKTSKAAAKANARKPAANGSNARFDWSGAAEKAAKGIMPAKLEFSAETHTRFRPALAEVEKLAKDSDLAGLKKWKYDGFAGSSVKAINRWRDLCVTALTAKHSTDPAK